MAHLKNPIILLTIGDRLRELRKKKNMTQEDIAYKAGIAVSQVARIERGELNPTVVTLSTIATALDMELKELFYFKKPPAKKKKNAKGPDQK